MLDDVKKVFKNSNLPKTTTSEAVKNGVGDLLVKAIFFANIMKLLLLQLRSCCLLVPLLYEKIYILLSNLMEQIIKKRYKRVQKCYNVKEALVNQYGNKTNTCNWKDVDIGVAATLALEKRKVSIGEKTAFIEDCIKFAINIILKLKECSPLKYKFTRACAAFLPSIILSSSEKAKMHMFDLLMAIRRVVVG